MAQPARPERSRARAWALQALYRWEMGVEDGDPRRALHAVLRGRRVAAARQEHLERLVEAVAEHHREIDRALDEVLENWRLERLSVVDRSVLRLGAAEILFLPDVPDRVAIQEAVRLAERYGSAESASFVNGVLDALHRRRSG